MRIRSKLVLAILAVLVLASLVFSVVTYQTQKSALLKGIDEKLLTAAHIVQAALGENYHDAIENSQSVNSAR
ncbi:MAG TPA: hypothetical protein PLP17_17220, partial [Oligoflexia bacterium]|nr:hypothetical protein [Oligoflexia bacterium]